MARRKTTKGRNRPKNQTNKWDAIRDVFIEAIRRGQLLPLMAGLVVLLIIAKLPNGSVLKLVQDIIDKLIAGYLLGWVLFVGTLLLSAWNSRRMRQRHFADIDRVGKERNELQKQLLGKEYKSSKGKGKG